MLGLVNLRDDVLAEIGLERHVAGEPAPHRANSVAYGIGIGLVVAHHHPLEGTAAVAEHDRLDRASNRSEARILDYADDRDRGQPIFGAVVDGGAQLPADSLSRISEAEPAGRQLIDDDVDSAPDDRANAGFRIVGIDRGLVARTVLVERPARDEIDAHCLEESRVDGIAAHLHRLGPAGNMNAVADRVRRADSDAGPGHGFDAFDSGDLVDDRLALIGELSSADILDLEKPVPAETRIGAPRINGLGVDDRGADDEADRHGELGDNQDASQATRAGRLSARLVGLEHLRRLIAAEVEGGIEPADGADDDHQDKHRQGDALKAEIMEL